MWVRMLLPPLVEWQTRQRVLFGTAQGRRDGAMTDTPRHACEVRSQCRCSSREVERGESTVARTQGKEGSLVVVETAQHHSLFHRRRESYDIDANVMIAGCLHHPSTRLLEHDINHVLVFHVHLG